MTPVREAENDRPGGTRWPDMVIGGPVNSALAASNRRAIRRKPSVESVTSHVRPSSASAGTSGATMHRLGNSLRSPPGVRNQQLGSFLKELYKTPLPDGSR